MLTFENRKKLRQDEAVIAGRNSHLLSDCELDAVLCAQDGMTDKEIALVLGVAHRTIVTLLERARHKIDAKNRAHLVSQAFQRGVIAISRDAQSGKVSISCLVVNLLAGIALAWSIGNPNLEQRRPRSQSSLVKVVRNAARAKTRTREEVVIAGVALDF